MGWLKDGRLLVSDFSGHLTTLNPDGSNRNVVFETNLPIIGMSVCQSVDRVLLAMPNKQTRGINIFWMDVAGGKPTAVTSGKFEQNVACSPDGKFFVYTSLINGKQFVMRMPTEGGQPKQLSDDFAFSAAISPDGEQVAFFSVEGQGIQAKAVIKVIPASGGAPIKVFDVPVELP